MKKILFMLATAAAVLSSCVKSEVVDVADTRVIGFEPFVNKTTKANLINSAGPADNDLNKFWVLGYEDTGVLFDGTDAAAKVVYNASDNGFTYDSHKTWSMGKFGSPAKFRGN